MIQALNGCVTLNLNLQQQQKAEAEVQPVDQLTDHMLNP